MCIESAKIVCFCQNNHDRMWRTYGGASCITTHLLFCGLCGSASFFSNAIPWGGGFLGDALNWFNGGTGNWAISGDFGIKFGESLKIISKKFAYV